jgi:deazaflavin-dependent oxidoreductase (nitroreductase family)
MKTYSAQTVEKIRQAFKIVNFLMLLMWRLGLRKWINICPPVFGRILVITHIGRVTGLRRRTPANYTVEDDQVYCMAGFGQISDWYRNMMKNPQVEIWLPNSWWAGTAEEVIDNENSLPILRQLIKDSGLAGLLFGLNAYKMSDEQLFAATKNYRLMRIRRTKRLHGRGGPGDLAWLWLIPAALLLAHYLIRSW